MSLNILIATDNHLGYNEKDPIRGNDSFQTFEEILQIARTRNVDAILLGGDLFHENKPSRRTLHRTIEMLRHWCMGDRPCELELLSDPSINFPSKFGTVNYEDPNYNVAMPVFIIHGNHDDPSGEGNLSSLDILSTAGLVNYFGKTANVDDISMMPILLRKGSARLALYGLGAIRDERLHRTFLQQKVRMLRPPTETEEWFSMLILHQNRVPHGPTNYIPETFLDDFLDLVVWGHEHECQACEPTSCAQRGFVVCQPGSSVATSLCDGEVKRKHAVILKIGPNRAFEMEAVPLETVRPFLMRDLVLRDVRPRLSPLDERKVTEYIATVVRQMIQEASSSGGGADLKLPLIRLRVDYSPPEARDEEDPIALPPSYPLINPQRFGQQFVGKVANPRDILHLVRRRSSREANNSNNKKSTDTPVIDRAIGSVGVEDLVTRYLVAQELDLLPQNELSDIVRLAVEKDDQDPLVDFLSNTLERTLRPLIGGTTTTDAAVLLERDSLMGEFERSKKIREDEWERLHPGLDALRERFASKAPSRMIPEDAATPAPPKRATSTRGRGRGRGAKSTAVASKRPRGKSTAISYGDDDEEAEVEEDTLDDEAIVEESHSNSVLVAMTPPRPTRQTPSRKNTATRNNSNSVSPSQSRWPSRKK